MTFPPCPRNSLVYSLQGRILSQLSGVIPLLGEFSPDEFAEYLDLLRGSASKGAM